MTYIQYDLKCQDFTDNGGDNKLCFMESIPKIVFAAEMGHFDEDWVDFNLGLLPLSLRMTYIQYHLKCQDFTDNGGDNKLSLMQSIPKIVFAAEIGHFDEDWWDFNLGFLS